MALLTQLVNAQPVQSIQIVEPQEATPVVIEVSPVDIFLDKLAECESGGNPKALNPHDYGSRSVGLYQFKDGTFAAYSKAYKLNNVPADIWNPEKQKELARLMLLDGGWKHWKNCSVKIGGYLALGQKQGP